MGNNNYNDPYLDEANRELEIEFPGARIDDSLNNHLQHIGKSKNKVSIFKKIVFHCLFYLIYSFAIFLLFSDYSLSIPASLTFGITYFLVYYVFKKTRKEDKK